jgi:hypothetical protein
MAAEISNFAKGEKGKEYSSSSDEVKATSPALENPPMATIEDDDELLLARIGYKQVKDMLIKHTNAHINIVTRN